MLDYGMKVSEELTVDDMMTSLYNLMNDGSKFLGDLLDRLDTFNESAAEIAEGLHEMATSLREASESNHVQMCNCANVQKKEASSSSPLSSPLKDEERTKEEEINPSIISPSSSEENSLSLKARAEFEQIEHSFDDFWNAYGYKVSRKRAWTAWKNLSKRDREAARAAVEAYKAHCEQFNHPMCHAVTYLHQRRWEDDFSSGLQNAEIINGRKNIFTREDVRKLEQQQRMQTVADLAAEYRAGIV